MEFGDYRFDRFPVMVVEIPRPAGLNRVELLHQRWLAFHDIERPKACTLKRFRSRAQLIVVVGALCKVVTEAERLLG